MEASSSAHYHPFHQTLCTPPPIRHHGGVGRRSAMRLPILQRITTTHIRSHRTPTQSSLTNTTYLDLNTAMDNSDAKKEIKSGVDDSIVVKDTKPLQKPLDIPPPPEKPLPGDCCGSGCVRCVWDVYYEELEEYNKLRKDESDSTVGSKVS